MLISLHIPLSRESSMKNKLWMNLKSYDCNKLLLLITILLAIIISYLPGKPLISDSKWSILASYSLIKEGNYDLNEYRVLLEKSRAADTTWLENRTYPIPAVGVSLMAVPFVLIIDQFTDVRAIMYKGYPTGIEHFIASFYVALAAVFIYLIISRFIEKKRYSLLLVFIFAYCTSSWSTASLGLFMHGPSMLMLAIALYLLLRAEEKPSLAQYAALPLAFSIVVRPTNVIPVTLFTAYIAFQYRNYLLRYMFWGILIAIPFLIFNLKTYGAPLPPYYGQATFSPEHLLEGLAGNLISPARGLLVFSPVLIFSFLGVFLKIKRKAFTRLDYCILAIIVLHWITISYYDPWWGGHSYGPRYFTDMLPFFIYFMIPAMTWLATLKVVGKVVWISVLLLLTGISLFAHYQGTANNEARDWNVHSQIFENQWRLWDWTDVPYLRTDFHDEQR